MEKNDNTHGLLEQKQIKKKGGSVKLFSFVCVCVCVCVCHFICLVIM